MTVITQSMYLINPNIGRMIVDNFIYGENAAENLANHPDMLIKLLIGMLLFTLLRTVFQYTANIFYEISSQGLVYRIRTYLFDNVQKQDARFFDHNRTGDIMTRLSGDLDMVRHSVAWVLKTLVEALVLFTSSAVFFFIIDPLMAVCILALTPVIFIVSWIFKKKAGPLYQDLRDRLSGLNTAAEENISGNRVVKAFAREEYEKKRFDEFNNDYSEANKKANLTWLTFFPAIEGTAQALAVVQLVAGGLFVISGRITLGDPPGRGLPGRPLPRRPDLHGPRHGRLCGRRHYRGPLRLRRPLRGGPLVLHRHRHQRRDVPGQQGRLDQLRHRRRPRL